MKHVVASAPGKIVLSGEYAVLGGAPAIAMAVDRRANVSIRPAPGRDSELSTHGFAEGRRRFRRDRDRIRWLDALPAPDALSLFEAVLAESRLPVDAAVVCEIDSRAFADGATGEKLGLGSSAAVAAALTAACLAWQDRATDVQAVAARAHSRHQSGRGSGVDVATSVSGGLVRYVRNCAAERIDWPPGLDVAILFSGRAASTSERIAGLDTSAPSAASEALAAAATGTASAWSAGDAASILEHMQAFIDSLSAFEVHYRRGIFEAGHGELVELAAEYPDLVYKPCGAGGGDVGMALASDREALEVFVARAAERGFSPLSARLDPVGASVGVTET